MEVNELIKGKNSVMRDFLVEFIIRGGVGNSFVDSILVDRAKEWHLLMRDDSGYRYVLTPKGHRYLKAYKDL